MGPSIKRGYFDYANLTIEFGHEKSKPGNRFTAQAVKVPPFKHTYREREDAGGGCYYNNWIETTETVNNAYIILRDGVVIGWMMPEHPRHNIKSELRLLEDKHTFKAVKAFAESFNPRPPSVTAKEDEDQLD